MILLFAVLFYGKILLSAGADVDMTDNDGKTALMWAAGNGWSRVAEVRNMESFSHNYCTFCCSDNVLCETLSIHFTIYQKIVVLFVGRHCCLEVLLLIRSITKVRQH